MAKKKKEVQSRSIEDLLGIADQLAEEVANINKKVEDYQDLLGTVNKITIEFDDGTTVGFF